MSSRREKIEKLLALAKNQPGTPEGDTALRLAQGLFWVYLAVGEGEMPDSSDQVPMPPLGKPTIFDQQKSNERIEFLYLTNGGVLYDSSGDGRRVALCSREGDPKVYVDDPFSRANCVAPSIYLVDVTSEEVAEWKEGERYAVKVISPSDDAPYDCTFLYRDDARGNVSGVI